MRGHFKSSLVKKINQLCCMSDDLKSIFPNPVTWQINVGVSFSPKMLCSSTQENRPLKAFLSLSKPLRGVSSLDQCCCISGKYAQITLIFML